MNEQSLGRIVKLRIYATSFSEPGQPPVITYDTGYTEFISVDQNGDPSFRIKGRVVLVQPTAGFNTNAIAFSIYNLGADSRALLQSKVGTKIELFAGYGSNVKQIALGDVLWANTYKSESDYITDVIAGDSHFGLVNGSINTSFKGSVTYDQVITALTSSLAPNKIFAAVVKGIPPGGYNNGIVLSGSPFNLLAEICKKLGLSFSVVGGGIYIIPYGQDSGSPVIEVSVDTGLIGIPEIQPPGLIGVIAPGVPVTPDNDISFTHLLRADLVLSQRVLIKSKFINGEYVIGRVTMDFDSWTGPFYSRCEAFKVATS